MAFETWGIVSNAITGTAVSIFVASTKDSRATMLAPGYLNYISKNIKANDRFYINYSDTTAVYPLNSNLAAIYGAFRVQYDPVLLNWNLIADSQPSSQIASMGLHSASYSNAGGSATTVVSDPAVSQNSVIIARWKSSANAVNVLTVLPANGSFTVVSSGDPGASVLEYISVLPSVALQNLGVVAGRYSYAGGSATFVIPNASVVAGMVVEANFVSQTNATGIDTVIAGAGTITVVCTTNPGASVIEFLAALPSSALSSAGLFASQYVNAGGSATTTISDANITANSIVVANWASQASAALIQKVTPSAGSLVVLSSADPGASVLNYSSTQSAQGAESGVFLQSANNLSDVQSASASLANLGGLPLAGGQMTGQLLFDRGTATSTAGAATINHQAGVVTTEALTTASGSAYSFTLTNSRITTASVVVCQLMGGSNTKHGLSFTAVPSSGSAAISVLNNDISAAALDGTLIFGFVVF